MNQITNIRNGSIVSCLNGKEENGVLQLPVSGIANPGAEVFINDIQAKRNGISFFAEIPVTEKFSTVKMQTFNEYGEFTQSLKVVWDKASFPRYNFFIDDNIFFLTDIAKERPKSLFDHFYLAFLKRMHDTYGTKFTLNLFYQNSHYSFELKDFPDCYKGEFEANSDWLRLSWHAYAEFPDRPYQNASNEKLESDIRLLTAEICRFAGEKTFIPPVAGHWSMYRPEAFPVLRKHGVKALCGQFTNPQTSLSEKGPAEYLCDIGYFRNLNDSLYLGEKQLLYDITHEMMFVHSLLICNYFKPEEITAIIDRAAANPDYNNLLSLETHEQYSFPYYFNYLPDHFDRIEAAIHRATELGYKPVFYAEGLLGNTAWEC